MVHFILKEVTGQNFYRMMYFCPWDLFILANSADPDEMPPYAAFHLGLHGLPKYLFLCIKTEKG